MAVSNGAGRAARRIVGVGFLAAIAALPAGPAAAAVIETLSVSSSYGFITNSNDPGVQQQIGGESETFIVPSTDGPNSSELGIEYVATARDGGFFFLHQNYCVGTCSTFSQSTVTITLENTGPTTVDLRFDSQITPGHLSLMSPTQSTNAQYVFTVAQSINGGEATSLYGSSGSIIPDGLLLDTGGLPFTGLETINPPMSNWAVTEWGATNLSVPLLRLEAGATSILTYTAIYYVRNDGECVTLDTCSSAEIVFGDPRNNGSVPLNADAFGAAQAISQPVIGGIYAPHFVPVDIVAIDAPPPNYLQDKAIVDYTPIFTSRAAIPEPSTWAMMIAGFGATGAAMRRRRRRRSPRIGRQRLSRYIDSSPNFFASGTRPT